MMNENDIKKELDNYEIKTTSKMILDRLPKKKHYKFNPLIILTLSISTLGMAAAVLALALTLNMKNNPSSNHFIKSLYILNMYMFYFLQQ